MPARPLTHDTLRTAIILLERPAVGDDGPRGRARLPPVVRLHAEVVDVAVVDCLVEAAAVRAALSGASAATWSDLEVFWQDLVVLIRRKIRAGEFSSPRAPREPLAIRITAADVGPHFAAGRPASPAIERPD